MTTPQAPSSQPGNYLADLQHFLDLARHTATTASADGNHRLVIQAIREGSRLITQILKLTAPPEPKQGRGPMTYTDLLALESVLDNLQAVSGDCGAAPPPERQTKNPQTHPGSLSSKQAGLNLDPRPTDLTRDLLRGMFHPQAKLGPLGRENSTWAKSGPLPGPTPAPGDSNRAAPIR